MLRRVSIGLGVAGVVVCGVWWWWTAARPGHHAPSQAPWVGRGQSVTYQVRYRAIHGDQDMGAATLGGNLELEGAIRLTDHGAGDRGELVGLQLVGLDAVSLVVLGQEALDRDRAELTLVGPELVAEHVGGQIVALGCSPEAPPLFCHLARALLLEMQVVRPAAATAGAWIVTERTPRGLAPTRYTRSGSRIDKWRETYVSLDALPEATAADAVLANASFAAQLDEAGLVSLAGTETVLAESGEVPVATLVAEISARRVARENAPRRRWFGARWWSESVALSPLAPPRPSAAADVRALRLQTNGLTRAAVLEQIVAYGRSGIITNQSEWLWRATGLLELEPDLATELVALFREGSANSRGRALIADLLVASGNEAAQRALVDILSSGAARHDPGYARLLSRPALLERPSAEIVALLHDRLETEEGTAGQAVALALGSVVGASREAEIDSVDARAAHESLRRRLTAAAAPEHRALYLRALGNVGSPDDLPLIADGAAASEDDVRMAAARAVRKLDDAGSEGVLFDLLGDRSPRVQHAALVSLTTRPLPAHRLGDIDALVVEGRFDERNLDMLVGILARTPSFQSEARTIYRHILAQDLRRSELAARLRVLLEEP